MTFSLDLKAIGLGLLSYLVGWLTLGVLLTAVINFSNGLPDWLKVGLTIVGNLLPMLAAFVGAYLARSHRVLHGIISGSICVVLIFAGTLIFRSITVSMVANTALAVLIASLGAIFGSYARSRRGP
jgi:hypothetical protein